MSLTVNFSNSITSLVLLLLLLLWFHVIWPSCKQKGAREGVEDTMNRLHTLWIGKQQSVKLITKTQHIIFHDFCSWPNWWLSIMDFYYLKTHLFLGSFLPHWLLIKNGLCILTFVNNWSLVIGYWFEALTGYRDFS